MLIHPLFHFAFFAGKSHQPEVFLSDNPFVCNCEMEWIPRANELSDRDRHPRVGDLSNISCQPQPIREAAPQPITSVAKDQEWHSPNYS
jgi:hypothetical protein